MCVCLQNFLLFEYLALPDLRQNAFELAKVFMYVTTLFCFVPVLLALLKITTAQSFE
jgi:hypothetical protein